MIMYVTYVILTFACLITGVLFILYFAIQFQRLYEVIRIRKKWRTDLDDRCKIYSFDDMYRRTKKNWYGLKMPKEKYFK